MPKIIDNLIEEHGATLDEKAKESLSKHTDAVNALSILCRLTEKTAGEVRNPSAFVATSVKTAQQKPAGPAELTNAVQFLSERGMLDEKAQEFLKKKSLPEAFTALSGLLVQDASNVRNASAYVTRNAVNESKKPKTPMGIGPLAGPYPGAFAGSGPPPWSMGGFPFFFRGQPLDADAQGALGKLRPEQAMGILQRLESSGSSVRNPSAYVVRSCANLFKEEGEHAKHMASGMPLREQLDNKAQEALSGLGGEVAEAILQEMELKGNITNPSAYVQRAVANADRDAKGLGGPGDGERSASGVLDQALEVSPTQSLGLAQTLVVPEALRATLDDKAVTALESVPPDVAERILLELDMKKDLINNPSAYVQRSVANEARQPKLTNEVLQLLDETSKRALEDIGVAAANAILSELEKKCATITNPSAYVLRAVTNARKGQGLGGQAASLQAGHGGGCNGGCGGCWGGFGAGCSGGAWGYGVGGGGSWGSDMGFDGWAVGNGYSSGSGASMHNPMAQLDARAVADLQSVGPHAASAILQEMESKGTSVRNKSAYVCRSVANYKANPSSMQSASGADGFVPPPLEVPGSGFAGAARGGTAEIQSLLSQVGSTLDNWAVQALLELGEESAVMILSNLAKLGPQVANPSAYVMKAVANDRRAGIPAAKRVRID